MRHPVSENTTSAGRSGLRRRLPSAPPRREEIAPATLEVLRRGPRGKADLLVVDTGEGPLVVKDFASKSWPRRLVGRFHTWYECRAYQRLGPMEGVPALIGRIDAHALAVEKIEGVQLTLAADRYTRGEEHLAQIRQLMDRFLERGFAHLDIRARRNVMLRSDGKVIAIDLGGALWFRPDGLSARFLRPVLERFYRQVELKWKTLLTPDRLTAEDEARLARFRRSRRLWIFKRMRSDTGRRQEAPPPAGADAAGRSETPGPKPGSTP